MQIKKCTNSLAQYCETNHSHLNIFNSCTFILFQISSFLLSPYCYASSIYTKMLIHRLPTTECNINTLFWNIIHELFKEIIIKKIWADDFIIINKGEIHHYAFMAFPFSNKGLIQITFLVHFHKCSMSITSLLATVL